MCPTVWFYLAEMYRIQDDFGEVTLSRLADGMHVSLQTASRMIRRMAEEGHIIHEPYKNIRLTAQGTRIALGVIRFHRIIENYLVRVMGFGWDEVHEMTEQLEKAADEKLVERMYELAGRPTRCPHGEPIPTADGVMPELNDAPLTERQGGDQVVISRIKTHNPERLRYLAKVNMVPGTMLTVNGHGPFNGPVHLSLGSETHVLGYELANQVYVAEYEG
jgi:DtxR family Mn-dependent transcriptional regulator